VLLLSGFLLGGASADGWVLDSVLTGDLGTLDLRAVVTYDAGVYDYMYELTATQVFAPVSHIDVGNPYVLYYWDAYNTDGFNNPVFEDFLTSIIWTEGLVNNGEVVIFGYKSEWRPTKVPISAFDEGMRAEGITLGMVPEPSWAFAILLAVAPLARFRRR
jgi:hypothetical protein